MTILKWLRRLAVLFALLLVGPIFVAACGPIKLSGDWRTADRASTGIAPDPARTPEALVYVYSARAFNWRGMFGVHTWIATKAREADHYRVHQVIGWRLRSGGPVVVSGRDIPDRSWYGATPEVLAELRGPAAERAIAGIEAAAASYPFAYEYAVWPGPNSNTFTAYVARRVPELEVDLPTTAIGKDYLPGGDLFAESPSNTGYQASLYGVVGVTAALQEGLEINLLGLSFGLDPLGPALKLPGIGRLGWALDRQAPAHR